MVFQQFEDVASLAWSLDHIFKTGVLYFVVAKSIHITYTYLKRFIIIESRKKVAYAGCLLFVAFPFTLIKNFQLFELKKT